MEPYYIHTTNGFVDSILSESFETLSGYYGPKYLKCCFLVDYPVQIGYVWDSYQEKFVSEQDRITEKDLIRENKLLKAKLQAQIDRSDFIEDCIAEMATQVYGGV